PGAADTTGAPAPPAPPRLPNPPVPPAPPTPPSHGTGVAVQPPAGTAGTADTAGTAEVDGPIDRVRRAVTEGGSEDAMLVRTSDHGDLLGAHGGL
ncbi:hydrolase, partial [Mycobacterium tuberculosis]|nr:hydrolase [Mycobacterium tuberculosis]